MAMTPEEYEQFKEAEKAHLRKLREIKKQHQALKRKAAVTRSVTDMAEGATDLFSESDEMVERLQMDSASAEARLDVALDSLGSSDAAQGQLDAAELAQAEEELKKQRAQELIRQMKSESPSRDGSPSAPESSTATPESPASDETTGPSTSSDLPEKTIGRMKP